MAAVGVLRIPLTTIGDLAHPHHFLAGDLEDLVTKGGFETLATNVRHFEHLRRVLSHAYRMLIVARRNRSAE